MPALWLLRHSYDGDAKANGGQYERSHRATVQGLQTHLGRKVKTVWIATWYDTGSCESEIIGVYESSSKAEAGINAYHMKNEDCEAKEWDVE